MRTSSKIVPVALAVAGAAFAGTTVTPAEVARQVGHPRTAPYVLDVRTQEEFAEGHVPHAKNIPVQELETRLAEVPKDRDVVVYCQSGARASRAAALLHERGYGRISEMAGSMLAWRAAELPVEK